MTIRVEGLFRPPALATQVEPYPATGNGALEVTATGLQVHAAPGLPWEVRIGGLLGMAAGVLLCFQLATSLPFSPRASAAVGIVGMLSTFTAAVGVGHLVAARRRRKAAVVELAPAQLRGVRADLDGRVFVKVEVRRRWQRRELEIYFEPTDPAAVAPLVSAIQALLPSAPPAS